MSASKLEAGQLIIEAFKAALDTIDNFVGNDGPSYERAKRGLDVAEEFFRTEHPQPAEDPDEWVVQDMMPVRPCDQFRFSDTVQFCDVGVSRAGGSLHGMKHGDADYEGWILQVRCRRRDLPKVEQDGFADRIQKALTPEWIRQAAEKENGCLVAAGGLIRPQPQPQKTRVRLWIDSDCNIHAGLKGDRDLELHYDYETRQFYTEEQS